MYFFPIITLNIFYRIKEPLGFTKNDETTKTFLSVLFNFMKTCYIDKFSIEAKRVAYQLKPLKRFYVAVISIVFEDDNPVNNLVSWKKLDNDLNEAFNGDWIEKAGCVVETIEDVDVTSLYDGDDFFCWDATRNIKAFSHENTLLLETDSGTIWPIRTDQVTIWPPRYDEDAIRWHENPDFNKISALPYVAKELFACLLIENDLTPGSYEFEEEWNPNKIPKLKEEWRKAAKELESK